MDNDTTPNLTTKEKIIKHLKDDERDWAWLSRKSDIAYATIYGIFVQNTMDLNQERLNVINAALKTEFQLDVPAESPNA